MIDSLIPAFHFCIVYFREQFTWFFMRNQDVVSYIVRGREKEWEREDLCDSANKNVLVRITRPWTGAVKKFVHVRRTFRRRTFRRQSFVRPDFVCLDFVVESFFSFRFYYKIRTKKTLTDKTLTEKTLTDKILTDPKWKFETNFGSFYAKFS